MKSTGTHRALLAAALVLAATGTVFRVIEGRLSQPNDGSPLPAGTLARIPLSIGEWRGEDVPLDEAVQQATDTDDLINRRYTRVGSGGREVVGLYVAYGVQARDLMPHRPEVCYPGAGWNARGEDQCQLALRDGSEVNCRVLRFARGGFELQRVAVVNYYIVDGQFCPDVSLLRSKAWGGSRGTRYMLQVQVSGCSVAGRTLASSEAAAREFAAESIEAIRSVLPPSSGEDAAASDVRGAAGRCLGVMP